MYGHSLPDRKIEILFNVKSVKINRNNILQIEVEAHNQSIKKANLETSVHLHLAKDKHIKDRLSSQEKHFIINPQGKNLFIILKNKLISSVNLLSLTVDLDSVDLSKIFLEDDHYVVVTVLGHITCC